MDQLICASLSHTHYWYEVGMSKVPAAWRCSFFRVFLFTITVFSLFIESASYVFSFRVVFSYLVATGWIFYISLLSEKQSINQSINVIGVVIFFTLTDRASTVPSNIRGCQSGTWSAGQKKIK